MQNMREVVDIDKNEIRFSKYGATEEFKRQSASPTGIVTSELKSKARTGIGRTLEIPVIVGRDYPVQNVSQPLIVTDTANTSQMVAITAVDYYCGWREYPAQYANSEITRQRDFNRKMKGFAKSIKTMIEARCLSVLEANKTQVLNDTLGGRYSIVGGTVIAPWEEREYFMGDIDVLCEGNDYPAAPNIIGNLSTDSHIRTVLGELRTYNEKTKTYQYENKKFECSKQLANATGHRATMFAVQDDCLGFMQQQSRDCLMKSKTHNYVWDTDYIEMFGLEMGVMQYDAAVDGTGLAGAATADMTATKMLAFGLHTRIFIFTTWSSDLATKANPIMKVALANAV